jgi:MarR family transcriptional regulator, organic hydroperoxide resistance regulator
MNDRAAGPVDDDVTHLNDMVCFNLYAASRAVAAAYRPLLEPLDVTYPQYLVLATLWEYGDLSVGELSIRLQLEYGTMTPLLKRMEARGLVSRTRSVRDERTVIVSLAPAGEALRVHAPGIYASICEIFGFTSERAVDALAVLRSVTDHANRAAGTGKKSGPTSASV